MSIATWEARAKRSSPPWPASASSSSALESDEGFTSAGEASTIQLHDATIWEVGVNTDGHGQTIVISGASSGIGRETALMLAGRGYRVLAGVRRDGDGEDLRAAAAGIEPVQLDVTRHATIDSLSQLIADRHGGHLHALVNNAGLSYAGPFEFMPADRLRDQFEVNVIGHVAVTQRLLPHLRATRGRVINIGSVTGRMALPFNGPYSASKHALEAFTDALRIELRPWGIHVCVIEPGPIKTNIWDRGAAAAAELVAQMPPEGLSLYGPQIQRMTETTQALRNGAGAPRDVADVVLKA